MDWKEEFKQEVYESFRKNLFEYQLQRLAQSKAAAVDGDNPQRTRQQEIDDMKKLIVGFCLRYGASINMLDTIYDIFDDPDCIIAENDRSKNEDNFFDRLYDNDALFSELQQLTEKYVEEKEIWETAQEDRKNSNAKLTYDQVIKRQNEFNEKIIKLRDYLSDKIQNKELKKTVFSVLDNPILINASNDEQTNIDNFWEFVIDMAPSNAMKELHSVSEEFEEHMRDMEAQSRQEEEEARVAAEENKREQEFNQNVSKTRDFLNQNNASKEAVDTIIDVLDNSDVVNAKNNAQENYQNFMDNVKTQSQNEDVLSEIIRLVEDGKKKKELEDKVTAAVDKALKTAQEVNSQFDMSDQMEEYDELVRSISREQESDKPEETENESAVQDSSETKTDTYQPTEALMVETASETDATSETEEPAQESVTTEAPPQQPVVTEVPPQQSAMINMPSQSRVANAPAATQQTNTPAAIQKQKELKQAEARLKEEEEERRKLEHANFLVKAGDWIQRNIFDSVGNSIPILGSVFKMIGNIFTGLLKSIGHMFDGNWGEAGKSGLSWLKDTAIIGGAAVGGYALGKEFGWWGKKSKSDSDKIMGTVGTATSVIGLGVSALMSQSSTTQGKTGTSIAAAHTAGNSSSTISDTLQNQSGAMTQNGGLRNRLSQTGMAENSAEGALAYNPTGQKTNS